MLIILRSGLWNYARIAASRRGDAGSGSASVHSGKGDRAAVDDYLEAVRGVERRINLTEQQNRQSPVNVAKPLSIPDSYEEHTRLMFDLLVLAHRTDVTRVHTFQHGRELSLRSYPWIGVPMPTTVCRTTEAILRAWPVHKDQHVSRGAVCRIPREDAVHSRRRRLAAGSFHLPVWRGDERR